MNKQKKTKVDKFIERDQTRDGYARFGNIERSDKWISKQALTHLETNASRSKAQSRKALSKLKSIDDEENSVIKETLANYSQH